MSSPQVNEVEEQMPVGELDLLREQVRRLTLEKARWEQQHEAAGGPDGLDPGSQGPVTAPTHTVTRLVHVARDRPCPSFSGGPGEDTVPIETWIMEVRRCWEGRIWTVAEQVVFIHDHLAGNAKAEVEFHPEPERANPEQIFALLLEHFRNAQSYVHTLAQFCQLHQRADETVREFSYGLKRLMDMVGRATPGAVPNADQLLRDQLIEHVRDGALRRMLDQRVAGHPQMTFAEARGLAVKWEEARPPPVRARSQSCGPVDPATSVIARELRAAPTGAAPPPRLLAPSHVDPSVVSTQHQLAELTRLVAQLVSRLDHAPPPRGIEPGHRVVRATDGRPICFRCGEPGHIARYCSRGPGAERTRDPRGPMEPGRGRGLAPPAQVQALEVPPPASGNEYPLPRLAHGQGE